MTRQTLSLTLAVTGLLSGCATVEAPPIPADLERITYRPEPPPFCGDCRTTTVTVASDGRIWTETGYWAGRYRSWRMRSAVVQSSREIYTRFKASLEPFRPSAERMPRYDGEFCSGEFWSDSGGMVVSWSGPNGSVRRWFEHGCTSDSSINLAVQAARAALPVPE